jgi:hypothetical protein
MRWFFTGEATKIHLVFLVGSLGFAAVRDLLALILERTNGLCSAPRALRQEALEKGDHK